MLNQHFNHPDRKAWRDAKLKNMEAQREQEQRKRAHNAQLADERHKERVEALHKREGITSEQLRQDIKDVRAVNPHDPILKSLIREEFNARLREEKNA